MNLKQKLSNNELTIGSWITIGHPSVVEIMASAGFEWMTIDMEHSSITLNEAQTLISVIQARGIKALVRVGKNDDLVINVKNVDLFLNIGQGLEWGVWNFSRRYNCPLGPKALLPPYPTIGGPDWTEIVADASKVSFSEFANKFSAEVAIYNSQKTDYIKKVMFRTYKYTMN